MTFSKKISDAKEINYLAPGEPLRLVLIGLGKLARNKPELRGRIGIVIANLKQALRGADGPALRRILAEQVAQLRRP